jgi:hypothetical protein
LWVNLCSSGYLWTKTKDGLAEKYVGDGYSLRETKNNLIGLGIEICLQRKKTYTFIGAR